MADVLSPKDINPPTLKKLFADAYMETILDNEGDLRVDEDGLGCYVMPHNNGDRIKLLTVWQARAGSSLQKQLEFANRVNDTIITVRVSVSCQRDDSTPLIFFDYYIPVEGGITKTAVILATKHFLQVQKLAVLECGGQEVLG
jgi:hypothetical protein